MKKRFMALVLATVMTLSLFTWMSIGGNATESTATITFADLGLENGVQYTDPFDGGEFTVTFAGGSNDGKYYTTGSGIRVYGDGTMTVAAKSGEITEIIVTYDGTNKPSSDDVVDAGTYDNDTGTWTGSEPAVVFTRPSGKGHWRIQSVKATVVPSTGGDPTPTTYSISYSANPVEGGTVSTNDATTGLSTGDIAEFTAAANSGYTFSGWTVVGTDSYDVDDNTVLVEIDSDSVTVTANFTVSSTPTYSITYSAEPALGGTVSTDDETTGLTAGDIAEFTATANSGYTFSGWTVVGTDSYDVDDNTVIVEIDSSSVTVTANFTIQSSQTNTTDDVLNQSFVGVTGTSYSDWSGKTGTSGAVYAGNSAGGNSSIQLRSNNSNSGIVTTTSGGKITKVTVVWNSNTTNDRTLNVYGKNTAYSAASDLYSSTDQGDLIGTIVCGTSTELTISDEYTFVGVRSAGGAMYLTSITFTWDDGNSGNTCTHDDAEFTAAKAATCTEAGNIAYHYCPDCGKYFADDNGQIGDPVSASSLTILALGHNLSWNGVEGANGEHTKSCSRCSYTESEDCIDTDGDDVCDVCGAAMPAAVVYTLNTVLHDGDKVVIYSPSGSGALTATLNNNNYISLDTVTFTGNSLTISATSSVMVFTAEYAGSAQQYYLKTTDGKYLTAGGSMSFEDDPSDAAKWELETFSADDSTVYVHSVGYAYSENNYNQYLEYYSSKSGVTVYSKKNTEIYAFKLYTIVNPNAHVHTWDQGVVTTQPTCTTPGVKTYTCTDCNETYTEEIEALGHTWVDGTCTVCGAKKPDTLNRDFTGYTSGNYFDWSDKTDVSGAVYAGNSSGDHESIQLRSNNNNSGIVTTKSGGLVTKISVKWNTNTTSGRTLQIYGKKTAYTSAADLYGDNKGTLIGTIVYGTSTELTITDDYSYIGIRSASGALYLDEVQIYWNGASADIYDQVIVGTYGQNTSGSDVSVIGRINGITSANLSEYDSIVMRVSLTDANDATKFFVKDDIKGIYKTITGVASTDSTTAASNITASQEESLYVTDADYIVAFRIYNVPTGTYTINAQILLIGSDGSTVVFQSDKTTITGVNV